MIENFKGKENTNGFKDRPEDTKKGGRPVSFKGQFKELLEGPESVMWVDEIEIKEEDGKTLYGVKLSRVEQMLVRLDKIVKGKNDRLALDAVRFLWEQIDGKAKQTVDMPDREIEMIIVNGDRDK